MNTSLRSLVLCLGLAATLVVMLATSLVHASQGVGQMNDVGNFVGLPRTEILPTHAPEDVEYSSLPNNGQVFGLAFRGNELWGVTSIDSVSSGSGILRHLDASTGEILASVTITPTPKNTFGLTYDPVCDCFAVTDPTANQILRVDPATGTVLEVLPSPSNATVGTAYDGLRGGYWISDFEQNSLVMIDRINGNVINSFPAPTTTGRIADIAFHPEYDLLAILSRETAQIMLIRARDGAVVVGPLDIPPRPTTNNGQGIAIHPSDNSLLVSHFESDNLWIVSPEYPPKMYGLALESTSGVKLGAQGSTMGHELTIINQGNVPDTYSIAIRGNAWSTLAPTEVGPIVATEAQTVCVSVSLPTDALIGSDDSVTVKVVSVGDEQQFEEVVLTTAVGSGRLYLPRIQTSQDASESDAVYLPMIESN